MKTKRIIQEWPVIKSSQPDKHGKSEYWTIRVYVQDDVVYRESESWSDGSKHQTFPVAVREGKNRGRANETSPLQQALAEAAALWVKKRDKMCPMYTLPMLAHDYTKRGKDMVFPCYGQPKLDGHRMLSNRAKEVQAWTRSGKPYDMDVVGSLVFDSEGSDIDGELMLPASFPFQRLKSAVSGDPELVSHLEYHVYDVVVNAPYRQRKELLANLVQRRLQEGVLGGRVRLVPTVTVESAEQAKSLLSQFVAQGYEGLMLRHPELPYEVDCRSVGLQKFKQFDDGEFEIVGVRDGEGKEEGAAIFICRTAEGKRFETRPRGTYEQRQAWFKQREQFQGGGQWLTVRYFGMSEDFIPRFPVGVALRPMANGRPVL